jgi:fermentation-respiration switch protein FrsA (DUF1100 family)
MTSIFVLSLTIVTIVAALLMRFTPRFAEKLYSRLIFYPIKYPSDDHGFEDEIGYELQELANIPIQDVSFTSREGLKLHGWFLRVPDAKFTVIVNHSNWGNVTRWLSWMRFFLQTGFSVFIYDYRGYGKSEGHPSFAGISNDAVSAYDYLIYEQGIKPTEIIAFGHSLGGGAVCELASRRKCAGVIVFGTFSSIRELAGVLMPFLKFLLKVFPESLFFQPAFDNAKLLGEVTTPLLILHGDRDEMIPVSQAQKLYENSVSSAKQLVIIPDGQHSGLPSGERESYIALIRDFARNHCGL